MTGLFYPFIKDFYYFFANCFNLSCKDSAMEWAENKQEEQDNTEDFPMDECMKTNQQKYTPEDFKNIHVIGKGSYGKVYLVRKILKQEDNGDTGDEETEGGLYAMKVLKKAELRARKQVEHTKSERRILEKIRHPFVVGLHWAFQTSDKLYFVLDYWPGGELFFYIQHFQSFPENIARFYAANILLGLEELHKNNIVYRDLKPENVLIGKDGYAKITDFGLSKENIQGNQQANSFWGTPEYLAPETLLRKGTGKAADWWSFGAIVYEMMTGLPPYYDKNRQELYNNIKNKEIDFFDDKDLNEKKVSDNAKDFLSKILVKDPSQRLGSGLRDAEDIKEHPWFSEDGIDWPSILEKTEKPPYIPNLRNEDDVDHFDEQFTKMDPHGSFNPKGTQKKLSEDQWSDFDLDAEEYSD